MEKSYLTSFLDLFSVETIRGIDASTADVELYGTDEDDSWLVLGDVFSNNGHTAKVDMGTGHDAFRVFGNVESHNSGMTTISGAEAVTVSGKVRASSGGENSIIGGAISIAGALEAEGGGNDLRGTDISVGGIVDVRGGFNSIHATGSTVNLEQGVYVSGGAFGITSTGRYGPPIDITIDGDISVMSGSNSIFTDRLESKITVNGDVITKQGTSSWISASDGVERTAIVINGEVVNEGGENKISPISAQDGSLEVTGGITTTSGGRTDILASGNLTVGGTISVINEYGTSDLDYAENVIRCSDVFVGGGFSANGVESYNDIFYNGDLVSIHGGMEAIGGGSNIISLTPNNEGDKSINVYGDCTAYDSMNWITSGKGNDSFFIEGQVSRGGLMLRSESGYDVLTLNASTTEVFTQNYQTWLEGSLDSSAGINDFESLRVGLVEASYNFESLCWLNNFVESKNGTSNIHLDLELNIENYGSTLSLDDFFSGREDDIFTALNLGGEVANTISVIGSLADNSIDAMTFSLHGDSNDTVELSNDWFYIGDGSGVDMPDYSYYTTGFDLLMVQAEINVIVGA